MSKNINNKKVLAEKLKNHLNSPEYVAVPDLISSNSCGADLSYLDGGAVLKRRKFIDWEEYPKLINYDDLEPTDWEEIISLIKKRNEEREKNYQAKKKKIEDKVNSQPDLFYYYGSGSKDDRSNSSISYGDKKGRYFGLWGSENGRSFYLEINSNHPILDNFPWGKHGYYLIKTDKPIERNDGVVRPWSDGGENNSSNFNKWVEVGDKITITPYEVENDNNGVFQKKELEPKGKSGCDTCHKKLGHDWGGSDNFYIIKRYHGVVNIGGPVVWACQDCYSTKEQEYLQNYETVWERYLGKDGRADYHQIKFSFIDCYAGKKDQNGKILQQQNCSHCQPWNQHQNLNVSEMDIKSLIQYLQKNSVKEITFKNGELIITHNNNNNNEIVSAEKIDDKQELVSARNIIQKSNQPKLTKEDLEKMINANSNPASSTKKPKSDISLWVSCVIGGVLIIGVVVGLVVSKKRKNK